MRPEPGESVLGLVSARSSVSSKAFVGEGGPLIALMKINYFDVISNESTYTLGIENGLGIPIQVAIDTLKVCIRLCVEV